MEEYTVRVTEELVRDVKIKAGSKQDALDKVRAMYRDEKIVLDASDFVGAPTIEVVEDD